MLSTIAVKSFSELKVAANRFQVCVNSMVSVYPSISWYFCVIVFVCSFVYVPLSVLVDQQSVSSSVKSSVCMVFSGWSVVNQCWSSII